MKIVGKVKEIKELKKGKELVIVVDSFPYVNMIDDLEEKQYSIEINGVKSKRSLEQNRMMWALIHEIAEHTQGGDEMELYCQFLEIANAQFEIILCDTNVDINALRKVFRAVQFMGYAEIDGAVMAQYKVFTGSSRFNTSEMNKLIDVILKTAYELGIESYDYYFDSLRG